MNQRCFLFETFFCTSCTIKGNVTGLIAHQLRKLMVACFLRWWDYERQKNGTLFRKTQVKASSLAADVRGGREISGRYLRSDRLLKACLYYWETTRTIPLQHKHNNSQWQAINWGHFYICWVVRQFVNRNRSITHCMNKRNPNTILFFSCPVTLVSNITTYTPLRAYSNMAQLFCTIPMHDCLLSHSPLSAYTHCS